MAKIRKSISGNRIAPGVIEIELTGRKLLQQGQKVLIYKPTDKSIVSSSGRIIGKKERIFGVGEVDVDGEKLIVKTSRTGVRKPSSFRRAEVLKILPVTGGRRFTSSRLKMDTRVCIKPIEE